MIRRRKPLRCRLFGHDPGGFRPYGGWPEPFFELRSHCLRCGADTSVTVASTIVIQRGDANA